MSLAALIAKAHALDLTESPAQHEPTRRFVVPRLDDLIARLAALRAEVDRDHAATIAAARQRDAGTVAGEIDWARYPIGFCRHIRDAVLAKVPRDPFLQEALAAGVVIKPIFVLLKGSYFQNALQIGNYYVDVANDTVFPEKPKLDWAPIAAVDFENVDSWQRFAAVAETYLKVALFPNLLFPLAFPAAPFFAIRSNGRIDLLVAQHQIALKDLGQNLRRTRELLDNTTLMNRTLPPTYRELLASRYGGNLFEAFPLEFAPADIAHVRDTVLPEFRQLLQQPEAAVYPVMSGYFRMVENAAQILRRHDLRPDATALARLRANGTLPPAVPPAPAHWNVE